MTGPVVDLRRATVRIAGRRVLGPVDWTVDPGQRWVVLGPNGSGKSTLLALLALQRHPTSGSLDLLGRRLGATRVRDLRARIGVSGPAVHDSLRPSLAAEDVVVTAARGALEPWWHEYGDEERQRARDLLARVGLTDMATREFGTLSSGERQRVLLARALMTDPDLLVLDEPAAALDLRAREDLLGRLAALAAAVADERDRRPLAVVLVTHHLEEIPAGFSHALLLRAGAVVAQGPVDATLTEEAVSTTYDLPVRLTRSGDRWTAQAV